MKKKEIEGQCSLEGYSLKQVDVRLRLMDGPSYYSTEPLDNPVSAAHVMRDILKELDREWVCVVNLDNHLKPINFNVVSVGSVNQSLAPIQNIFKSAILTGKCSSIMLFHNHPSGDPTPSGEDVMLTRRLIEAGKLMDLPVVDHLVVAQGSGKIVSFRKSFPDMFKDDTIDIQYLDQMMAAEKKAKYNTVSLAEIKERHKKKDRKNQKDKCHLQER